MHVHRLEWPHSGSYIYQMKYYTEASVFMITKFYELYLRIQSSKFLFIFEHFLARSVSNNKKQIST